MSMNKIDIYTIQIILKTNLKKYNSINVNNVQTRTESVNL